jgi:hypothetical protein
VGRRPLLVIAGWLGAAVLALFVGLAATDVIGRGLASSSASAPLSPSQVAEQLATVSTATAPPTAPSSGPSSAGPSSGSGATSPATTTSEPVRATFSTSGGVVIAQCVGARVEIRSMSPAQGYAVHERGAGGPDDSAEGEFRGTSDNHDRVKIHVRGAGGAPRFDQRTG